MALDTNATKLANLFNPEVVADMINAKLTDAMRFAPLARIDTTLVGRPGNTVTLPSYAYIGDAATVGEGDDIAIAQLTESTTTATVHKIGKGVQVTDEALLSGYGDPAGEIVKQLRTSIASQVDNEVLAVLAGISGNMAYTATGATLATDDVADALVKYGEDIEGEKVLVVSPEDYAVIRKADDWCPASEIGASLIIEGAVGKVHGCQVVISNKLRGKKAAYIVKPGALAIYMKRDVMVETDRDIINKSTVVTADKHFVVYLYDASKAIKISLT